MDDITHITTEAVTIDTAIKGITTGITMADTTIGTAVGLSALVGVQDTIAIGKPIDARGALCSERPGRFPTRSDRSAAIGLDLMNCPHHHARQIKGEI
jgi:hypothetical protein